MQVWDGRRPRSDRTVVSARGMSLQGLDFRFVAEAVTAPTDWCFQEPHHVFVIHRRGDLKSMEIDFENGPSGRRLPRVGDVWVIPAEHRYAALAQGAMVGFCEIIVPTAVLGEDVVPRVGYQDTLLHRLVERLAGQANQEGAAANLFRQSLAETLQLHIADHYGIEQNSNISAAASVNSTATTNRSSSTTCRPSWTTGSTSTHSRRPSGWAPAIS